jgi:hypothetical protein
MAIDMVPVNSTAAKAVGYDPATRMIHVAFHSGGTHPHGPFTQQEFERFRDSGSIGKHYHAHIRAKAIK